MPKNVNNLIIGLDFDGVIIDHTENIIKMAQGFGFSPKPEETPGHRLRKIIGESNYLKIRRKLYGSVTKSSVPTAGVLDCLQKLKLDNYQLYIISARYKEHQPIAWEWINHYLIDILKKQQVFFIEQERRKNSICQKLKIDIYLDDKVDILKTLFSVPKRCLFDRYNIKNDFQLGDIKPISSWLEFAEYVKAGH
jgi:uncharacterized HAD superfamily protein